MVRIDRFRRAGIGPQVKPSEEIEVGAVGRSGGSDDQVRTGDAVVAVSICEKATCHRIIDGLVDVDCCLITHADVRRSGTNGVGPIVAVAARNFDGFTDIQVSGDITLHDEGRTSGRASIDTLNVGGDSAACVLQAKVVSRLVCDRVCQPRIGLVAVDPTHNPVGEDDLRVIPAVVATNINPGGESHQTDLLTDRQIRGRIPPNNVGHEHPGIVLAISMSPLLESGANSVEIGRIAAVVQGRCDLDIHIQGCIVALDQLQDIGP